MSGKKVQRKSRAKTQYSRVVQVVMCGALLKSFDAEVIREESKESSVARDLIQECLKSRIDARSSKVKNHFFG